MNLKIIQLFIGFFIYPSSYEQISNNFMFKITRKSSLIGSQTTRNKSKANQSLKLPKNKNFSIIPSLKQAQQIVNKLESRHKFQKKNRKKKLQETYQENCRLYLSIKSQKSHYALPTRKESKNFSRLPLLQKVINNSAFNTTTMKLINTPCLRYFHNATQFTNKTQMVNNFEEKSSQQKQLIKAARRKSLKSKKYLK